MLLSLSTDRSRLLSLRAVNLTPSVECYNQWSIVLQMCICLRHPDLWKMKTFYVTWLTKKCKSLSLWNQKCHADNKKQEFWSNTIPELLEVFNLAIVLMWGRWEGRKRDWYTKCVQIVDTLLIKMYCEITRIFNQGYKSLIRTQICIQIYKKSTIN